MRVWNKVESWGSRLQCLACIIATFFLYSTLRQTSTSHTKSLPLEVLEEKRHSLSSEILCSSLERVLKQHGPPRTRDGTEERANWVAGIHRWWPTQGQTVETQDDAAIIHARHCKQTFRSIAITQAYDREASNDTIWHIREAVWPPCKQFSCNAKNDVCRVEEKLGNTEIQTENLGGNGRFLRYAGTHTSSRELLLIQQEQIGGRADCFSSI